MTTSRAKPRQNPAPVQREPISPESVAPEPLGPLVLRLPSGVRLTEEQVLELSSLNPELRIEINAHGELELMPPTGAGTGSRNTRITLALGNWALEDGSGESFDSSTGFTLANGAIRSPDASWVLKSRLAEIPEADWDKYAPLCPDFVLELRSPSDRVRQLQAKMEEYLENGARLGWLIDPLDPLRRVYIYRPGAAVEVLEAPDSLSGDPELPGFVLDLTNIWEPPF